MAGPFRPTHKAQSQHHLASACLAFQFMHRAGARKVYMGRCRCSSVSGRHWTRLGVARVPQNVVIQIVAAIDPLQTDCSLPPSRTNRHERNCSASPGPHRTAGRHRQGRLTVSQRQPAKDLEGRRTPFPRTHHQPRQARSARRQNVAGRRQDRPPRSDHIPIDQLRPELERGATAAGFCKAQQRVAGTLGRPHLLADARACCAPTSTV